MNRRWWVALVLCCTFTSRAAAQSQLWELRDLPPGPDQLQPLRKGDPAPYQGILFDGPTALRWGNWLEQYRALRPLERDYYLRAGQIEVEHQKRLLVIERDRAKQVEQDLLGRLGKVEAQHLQLQQQLLDPPWYRNGSVMLTLGALGSAVIFLCGILIIAKVQP